MGLKKVLSNGMWYSALIFLPASLRADIAVLIGVQKYSNVPEANTLNGPINDARMLGDVLKKKYQFDVRLIPDATRQQVFEAITQAAKDIKKDEKFVFFFAGHGRDKPVINMLPSDFTIEGGGITPDDLRQAIAKVPAKSRTVLLDCCFSGGMAPGSMSKSLGYVSRYFGWSQSGSTSKSIGPASRMDSQANLKPDDSTCYYTASMANEQALEGKIDGAYHGLFSYVLAQKLDGSKKNWADVHKQVREEISSILENKGRQQTPLLSNSFLGTSVFEPLLAVANGTPRPDVQLPKPQKVSDVLVLDRIDHSKLELALDPDETNLQVGQRVTLSATLTSPGYLIVMGNMGGKYYKLFPASGNVADAKVSPGKTTIGREMGLMPDTPGSDQVKAIFFTRKDRADALLKKLKELEDANKDGMTFAAMSKRLTDVPEEGPGAEDKFWTSTITYNAGEFLIGGAMITKAKDLLVAMVEGKTAVAKHCWTLVETRMSAVPEVSEQLTEAAKKSGDLTPEMKVLLILALNLTAQSESKPVYDEAVFQGVKLSAKTKNMLADSSANRVNLNVALLQDAFPDFISSESSS